MKMIRCFYILVVLMTMAALSQGQPKNNAGVYVDTNGILRWNGSNDEVSLFGVNYTVPFAYSYRAHKKLGLSLKKAIDLDVIQMSRLSLDAFRVHVWDREISDHDGNLIQNEHLDLFDYLLKKLASHGIKTIITPIAWWGNGYPEPDEPTKGFSQSYSRLELITNPVARAAQRNFLKQFLEHVNPYTGYSYRGDPSIIALEIINEPSHPESEKATADYINEMVGVLRNAGSTKPIFYNISQNWSDVQAAAVVNANVDGVSFQWYPTGLVHNKMLQGNYLLNVNHYPIPSERVAGFDKKAKMVYEFDAADVGGSYMYPAMIRSFRESGMQFATMFSYDPVQIAWSNTEYQTHFMNMLYTPSKALSLMIAAKAFRKLPLMKSYGNYPGNNVFDDFRVSYEEDLSEMNSDSEFIYSNSTHSLPKNASSIEHVAGCGNSALVQYDGTGAYFIDKIEPGIWRLEIYPDVLWIQDPFGVTSMSRQVARLFWRERKIKVSIPDLSEETTIHPWTGASASDKKGIHSDYNVRPGIYLVSAKSADNRIIKKYLSKKEYFLPGLFTPPTVPPGVYVVNNSSQYATESCQAAFKFQIASEQDVRSATLYIRRLGWWGFEKHLLKHRGGFDYEVTDTSKIIYPGDLEYCVAVEIGKNTFTFPEGIQNTPDKRDFVTGILWSMKIVGQNEPIVVLNASRDRKDFVFPHYDPSRKYSIDFKNGSNSDETALSLFVSFADEQESPFGVQLNVAGWVKPFADQLEHYRSIVMKARSNQDSLCAIGLNLIMANGVSYGIDTELGTDWQEIEIPLSTFYRRSSLLLPNSYPLFLPRIWDAYNDTINDKPNFRSLEYVQIIADPRAVRKNIDKREINFEIHSIYLKK